MDNTSTPNTDEWILQQAPRQLGRWNQYPFPQRLNEYLAKAWAPGSPGRPRLLTTDFELGYMVRDEDLSIVQKYVDQYGVQEKAFCLYWDSGLFDKAEALLNHLSQNNRDRVKADLHLCREFSKLGLWGRCEVMLALFRQVDQVCNGIRAYPDKLPNVLIAGETGTGKEKLAHAIHSLTGRCKFGAINCAEFSSNPELMRSELFGHVAGAFTGATKDKPGILGVYNDKGTVLLDEINSLPPELGADLLRVLQERKFRRVGETEENPVDTLFIAATNQDLAELVDKRDFREDLFSRLSGTVFRVPALKNRSEDIPLLVNQMLLGYGQTEIDKGRDELAQFFKGELKDASGNVRWLEQEVGRWVRLTTPPARSPEWAAINQAIDEAVRAGEELPLPKSKIAERMRWRGKKGVSRSLLSDAKWKPVVKEFVQEGKIKG